MVAAGPPTEHSAFPRLHAPAARRRLHAAAPLIKVADTLLFRRRPFEARRPSTWISKLIATSGRSDYTHAAKAVWWPDVGWMCVEVRELYGGRAVTLESQVRANPGLIDVFSPREGDYSRAGAARFMLSFLGQPYGYRAIARAARVYIPFLRLFSSTHTDDSYVDPNAVFCSEAVTRADRLGGGVDPVPNLADCETEPGDLARSELYSYQFTLEP